MLREYKDKILNHTVRPRRSESENEEIDEWLKALRDKVKDLKIKKNI